MDGGVESDVVAFRGDMDRFGATSAKTFVDNVEKVAEDALRRINDDFVPVDTGRLRESGRVEPRSPAGPGIWNIDLTYKTPYAAIVNNRPDEESRPDPARPSAGPHYLERGVIAALVNVEKRTAEGLADQHGGGGPANGRTKPL